MNTKRIARGSVYLAGASNDRSLGRGGLEADIHSCREDSSATWPWTTQGTRNHRPAQQRKEAASLVGLVPLQEAGSFESISAVCLRHSIVPRSASPDRQRRATPRKKVMQYLHNIISFLFPRARRAWGVRPRQDDLSHHAKTPTGDCIITCGCIRGRAACCGSQ